MRMIALAAVLGVGAGAAWCQSSEPPVQDQDKAKQSAPKKELTLEQKQEALKTLEPRVKDAQKLRDQAGEITAKIGKLASSGKLPTSDEGIKLLQDLVQELAKVNESLKKIQEEIDAIKGWMEGQNESLPVLIGDVENLKRATWGNYYQFQFADTQEGFSRRLGDNSTTRRTNNDGFQFRRIRLSTSNKIDPKTSVKASLDMATGSQRLSAELKDAFMTYDIEQSDVAMGLQAIAGQMNMHLGYELERSSSEREMPERSIYNRTMMGGERNRGVMFKKGMGANAYFHGGLWNSLTVGDPQLTNVNTFRNLNGTDVGATVGARTYSAVHDVGIGVFFAKRPRFSYTDFVAPDNNATATRVTSDADRRLVYVDGSYIGLGVPNLTLRGEVMFGRDRVPTLGTKRQTVGGSSATISNFPEYITPTNVLGYQLQATYNLSPRNVISLRWEYFDPDTGSGGNDQTGLGLSYIYYINPGARLMFAHESFKERAFELRNNVTTIRLQMKL